MSLRWLAEDDAHPVRPDLPIVRHFTFAEAHALELGAYVGLLAFFGLRLGRAGEVLTLSIAVVRFAMSDGRASAGAGKATHRLGFHDVRLEPPYFGAGFLLSLCAAVVGARAWSMLGLGGVAP